MTRKRTWREKLADKGFPQVAPIDQTRSKRWGTGTFVIPAPRQVDALMKRVPRGKLTTIDQIRARLAADHGATIACPITTGIFAWIAAHAADEAQRDGRTRITPYWRTLKTGGELNPKYPGGLQHIQSLLESEGHTIIRKGKRLLVANLDQHLARF
ncbi:MAG TPA: methylated DNA-protein cysteine methyltransferase [Tepidisphaeraceae bacterium]|jgi:alkylated DNA nucleotide flippase Atl1